MTTVNNTISVEAFFINSTSVNEYLLYLISLDIFTKYPTFATNCKIDEKYLYVNDLSVAIHHGVYISVQYSARRTGKNDDVVGCHRLPRIFTKDA